MKPFLSSIKLVVHIGRAHNASGFNGFIHICGKKVKVEGASVHHFIPTSRGGNKAGIFNQTGAHQSCNSRKSDTAPTWIEWFRYIRSTHRKLTVELDTIDLRAAYPELNGTP